MKDKTKYLPKSCKNTKHLQKNIMQKFLTAPKKIMQNGLRKTGQKYCICMRNKSMESCVQQPQRSKNVPVLRHIWRQFSPRSLGWLDAGLCAPIGWGQALPTVLEQPSSLHLCDLPAEQWVDVTKISSVCQVKVGYVNELRGAKGWMYRNTSSKSIHPPSVC